MIIVAVEKLSREKTDTEAILKELLESIGYVLQV